MKHIVFDIGAVLIDWNPFLSFEDAFDSRAECEAFLKRVNFDRLNVAGDAGATFAQMADMVEDPADAALLAQYIARYTKSVYAKIDGTWDILRALKAKGHPVHAITNWSAETWPEGVKAHPELGDAFETLIVSGEVRMVKPSLAIFDLLCERAGVAAGECIFIDDGLQNVAGARAAGMDAIHFTSPEALANALKARGVL